ncbi:MAG: copper amine oxidase N-terminal domain-containing protein [Bacillota bacterium]
MFRKIKVWLIVVVLGLLLAAAGISQAQNGNTVIPGTEADPLVTRSYVDQLFTSLENRLAALETKINQLPPPQPPAETPQPGLIQVVIDGQVVGFPDQKPYIDSATDRMLVPIGPVMRQVGAKADWSQGEQKATIVKGDQEIILWIGKKEARVNGITVLIDQPAVLVNDRTMVPLRFCSETLGYQVNWDPANHRALIQTT